MECASSLSFCSESIGECMLLALFAKNDLFSPPRAGNSESLLSAEERLTTYFSALTLISQANQRRTAKLKSYAAMVFSSIRERIIFLCIDSPASPLACSPSSLVYSSVGKGSV